MQDTSAVEDIYWSPTQGMSRRHFSKHALNENVGSGNADAHCVQGLVQMARGLGVQAISRPSGPPTVRTVCGASCAAADVNAPAEIITAKANAAQTL